MNRYAIILRNWFGYAAMITLMCVIIYVVGQQGFRQLANDPQFQLAEDAANAINKGADPKSLNGTTTPLEISKTLSPYLIIYDRTGNLVTNGALLNGKPLRIPQGVLNYIQKNGADNATWQPQPGVRQAMVAVRTTAAAKSYAVIAGRSLRKTEERIQTLGGQVAVGWVLSVIAMLVVVTLQQIVLPKKQVG